MAEEKKVKSAKRSYVGLVTSDKMDKTIVVTITTKRMDPLYKKTRKEWLKLYLPARSAIVLKKVRANGKTLL